MSPKNSFYSVVNKFLCSELVRLNLISKNSHDGLSSFFSTLECNSILRVFSLNVCFRWFIFLKILCFFRPANPAIGTEEAWLGDLDDGLIRIFLYVDPFGYFTFPCGTSESCSFSSEGLVFDVLSFDFENVAKADFLFVSSGFLVGLELSLLSDTTLRIWLHSYHLIQPSKLPFIPILSFLNHYHLEWLYFYVDKTSQNLPSAVLYKTLHSKGKRKLRQKTQKLLRICLVKEVKVYTVRVTQYKSEVTNTIIIQTCVYVKISFGHVGNPNKRKYENIRDHMMGMPRKEYFTWQNNMTCHNIFTKITAPPAKESLLWLGLNFCIQCDTPRTDNYVETMSHLTYDIRVKYMVKEW